MTLKGGYFSTATLNVIDVMKLYAPKTQQAWLTPTLINGATNYNATDYYGVSYYKDTLGVVHLRGVVNVTGTGWANRFMNLPVDYKPSKIMIFYYYC